ncbi:MAG TPA: LysO family transporter [Bacillota bacterium]|nr:LysO family transporter [Bacillota bacterium]
MWQIILALLGGLALGKAVARFGKERLAARFTLAGVMLLLFVMGAQIGSNPDVLNELPRIGAQAALMSVLCVIGALTLSLPLRRVKK